MIRLYKRADQLQEGDKIAFGGVVDEVDKVEPDDLEKYPGSQVMKLWYWRHNVRDHRWIGCRSLHEMDGEVVHGVTLEEVEYEAAR